MKAQSIVGYSKNRSDMDFYATPPEATEALFRKETFIGNVWECASGHGDMSRVIEKYNTCFSSDIRTNDEVYGVKGVDFLNELFLPKTEIDNIITNPPFIYAQEFLLQAKKIAKYKIAFILKLAFLEGKARYQIFQDKTFPLKVVYVFTSRLCFQNKGSGMIAFAWFVWDKSYLGKPYLDWISN